MTTTDRSGATTVGMAHRKHRPVRIAGLANPEQLRNRSWAHRCKKMVARAEFGMADS